MAAMSGTGGGTGAAEKRSTGRGGSSFRRPGLMRKVSWGLALGIRSGRQQISDRAQNFGAC